MLLDRDDRGGINDFVMVNGSKVPTATRQELVSIRGFVAGDYTINVYHFTALTGRMVPVTVTLQKLNPKVTIVAKETLEVVDGGTEKTALRFTMDEKGAVTKVDRTPKSILQTFYNPRANGAKP